MTLSIENHSSYPGDIVGRIAIYSLADLTPDELELLAYSLILIENMATDFDALHEDGLAYPGTDTTQPIGHVYLRPAYPGPTEFLDVWEAIVDVVRHEAEHLLIFAHQRAYFAEQRAMRVESEPVPAPSSVSEPAPTAPPVEVAPGDAERLAKLEEIADKWEAEFEVRDEAQAEAAGAARLHEWRELASSERDRIKFGKLAKSPTHWG
jgi:hypothetical protein